MRIAAVVVLLSFPARHRDRGTRESKEQKGA